MAVCITYYVILVRNATPGGVSVERHRTRTSIDSGGVRDALVPALLIPPLIIYY